MSKRILPTVILASVFAMAGLLEAATAAAESPRQPRQLRQKRIDSEHVLLTWRDQSNNEDGFEILRQPVFGKVESRGTVGPDVTEFLDESPDGIHIYKVLAFNEDGDSSFSNICYVNRNRPQMPLYFHPRLIALTVVRLRWHDRSDGERGFEIQRADFGGRFKRIATVPPNTEVFDDETLSPANSYTYRIRALGRPNQCWKNSRWTPERSVTTKGGVRILQVELRGRGKGTVTSDPPRISCGPRDDHCAAEFPVGSHVVLTAKPTAKSRFGNWQDYGRCEKTSEPCDVVMDEDIVIGAPFKKN